MTRGANVPVKRHSRPGQCGALARPRTGSHAGRAQLVQVHAGRCGQVLRPLFAFRETRFFLALPHDGQACHDGREGNQTDTQGANKRLPSQAFLASRPAHLHRTSANFVPNDRLFPRSAAAVAFALA